MNTLFYHTAVQVPILQCQLAFKSGQVPWISETVWIQKAEKKKVKRRYAFLRSWYCKVGCREYLGVTNFDNQPQGWVVPPWLPHVPKPAIRPRQKNKSLSHLNISYSLMMPKILVGTAPSSERFYGRLTTVCRKMSIHVYPGGHFVEFMFVQFSSFFF